MNAAAAAEWGKQTEEEKTSAGGLWQHTDGYTQKKEEKEEKRKRNKHQPHPFNQ
jgi:hypothetical protein